MGFKLAYKVLGLIAGAPTIAGRLQWSELRLFQVFWSENESEFSLQV